MARGGIPAAAVDLFENDRRFGDTESGAAKLLWNQRRQIPGVGQRPDERVRIRACRIELAPVAVGKCLAQIADRVAQILMKLAGRHGAIIDSPPPLL